MKKLLLRLIGLSPKEVLQLQKNIENLTLTIKNLKSEATEIYQKTEKAFMLYNSLKIDPKNERWWEGETKYFDDFETQRLADNIKTDAKIKWVKNHPSVKERIIFHGGCLRCITPINEGVGTCLGCKYLMWGTGLPDLSKKEL